MKYRVLEQEGRYYPQYKAWLFWHFYYNRGEPLLGCNEFITDHEVVSYFTLREAYSYIKTQEFELELDANANKITIHPYPPIS